LFHKQHQSNIIFFGISDCDCVDQLLGNGIHGDSTNIFICVIIQSGGAESEDILVRNLVVENRV
jgi:hypothetical protein